MTREELNEDIQNEIIEEQKKEKRKKRIKIFLKTIFFFIIASILFYAYTTYISTIKIGVREYRIINNKIPNSLSGIKIIQISDLHFGSTMQKEEMKKIINLTNERKPDIIVFTGDLIAKNYKMSSKEQEKFIKQLKQLEASLGKYAILGNEDDDKTITTIFNQSDFILLKNDYELIYKNTNTPILLIGISSTKKEQDIEKAYRYFQEEIHIPDIYTISLLHEPDTVDDILPNHSTDLFLAGHSHNGNIRIPFLEKAITKVEGAKKYDQEFYNLSNSKLYISSGLGTEKGIRLFCRPTINFFRLSNQ